MYVFVYEPRGIVFYLLIYHTAIYEELVLQIVLSQYVIDKTKELWEQCLLRLVADMDDWWYSVLYLVHHNTQTPNPLQVEAIHMSALTQ